MEPLTHSFPFNWQQGTGKVKYHPDFAEQAQVTLKAFGRKFSAQAITWCLNSLSVKERTKVLRGSWPILRVEVETSTPPFEICIRVDKQGLETRRVETLEKKFRETLEQLNQAFISRQSVLFGRYIDWFEKEELFLPIFWKIIESSKYYPDHAKAASNAITVLNHLHISFSNRNLSGICIPHADLSGAILARTNLSQANLRNANLSNACLLGANLTCAVLEGVKFGIRPYLPQEAAIVQFALSTNGQYLAVLTVKGIKIWNLKEKDSLINTISIVQLQEKNLALPKALGGFSEDSRFLLLVHQSSSQEEPNKLQRQISSWEVSSVKHIQNLNLPLYAGENIVCFSPNGQWIVYLDEKNGFCWEEIKVQGNKIEWIKKFTWKESWIASQKWVEKIGQEEARVAFSHFCFSLNSQLFAFITSKDAKKLLHVWSSNGTELAKWQIDHLHLTHLRFSFDHRTVLGVEDKHVWQWSITEKSSKESLFFKALNTICTLEIIAANKSYKKGCCAYTTDEHLICIRDLDKQQEICRFRTFTRNPKIKTPLKGNFILSQWQKTNIAIWKIKHISKQGMIWGGAIKAFHFSSNGQQMVTVSDGYIVNEYRSLTGENVSHQQLNFSSFRPHPSKSVDIGRLIQELDAPSTSLKYSFSVDLRYFILVRSSSSATKKCELCLLDIKEKKEIWYQKWDSTKKVFFTLIPHQQLAVLCISQDEVFIEIWDINKDLQPLCSHKLPYYLPSIQVNAFASYSFPLWGHYFAIAIKARLFLIEFNQGEFNEQISEQKNEYNFKFNKLPLLEGEIQKMLFVRLLGKMLLVLAIPKATIKCLDVKSQEYLDFFGHQKSWSIFDISQDSSRLAFVDESNNLSIWNIQDQRRVYKIGTHVKVAEIKFSPDGQKLAVFEKETETLYMWEIGEKQARLIWCTPKNLICQKANIKGAHFDSDGLNRKLLEQLIAVSQDRPLSKQPKEEESFLKYQRQEEKSIFTEEGYQGLNISADIWHKKTVNLNLSCLDLAKITDYLEELIQEIKGLQKDLLDHNLSELSLLQDLESLLGEIQKVKVNLLQVEWDDVFILQMEEFADSLSAIKNLGVELSLKM